MSIGTLITVMPDEQEVIMLSTEQARQRIARLRNHWQSFWFELKEFHDLKGWLPLGYTSFKECVSYELGMSEQRAYQILCAAKLATELRTQDVLSMDGFRVGHAEVLASLPATERLSVARQVDFSQTPVRELREIVRQAKVALGESGASTPHVSYNSGNNEWYTPAEYIQAARAVMGTIDLDPASSVEANEVVDARLFYTAESDGLQYEWRGRIWLNPPYAAELIGKFAEKLAFHVEAGQVEEAICLVNNATETAWFQRLINVATAVVFPRGRVRFWQPDGVLGAPLQGQAVIYSGPNPDGFLAIFRSFGWGARLR